jgi:hypothetical protein
VAFKTTMGMRKINLVELRDNESVARSWKQLITSTTVTQGIEADLSESTLKEQIIKLYSTVRGFGYVAKWMEKYKQSKGKTIQKAKPLRTKIASC